MVYTMKDPYKILTINIHSMGVHLSEDEVREFIGQFSLALSVRHGYNHKTNKPKDYIIAKLVGRLGAMAQVVKNNTFRGRKIQITLLKVEDLTPELAKVYK